MGQVRTGNKEDAAARGARWILQTGSWMRGHGHRLQVEGAKAVKVVPRCGN